MTRSGRQWLLSAALLLLCVPLREARADSLVVSATMNEGGNLRVYQGWNFASPISLQEFYLGAQYRLFGEARATDDGGDTLLTYSTSPQTKLLVTPLFASGRDHSEETGDAAEECAGANAMSRIVTEPRAIGAPFLGDAFGELAGAVASNVLGAIVDLGETTTALDILYGIGVEATLFASATVDKEFCPDATAHAWAGVDDPIAFTDLEPGDKVILSHLLGAGSFTVFGGSAGVMATALYTFVVGTTIPGLEVLYSGAIQITDTGAETGTLADYDIMAIFSSHSSLGIDDAAITAAILGGLS